MNLSRNRRLKVYSDVDQVAVSHSEFINQVAINIGI